MKKYLFLALIGGCLATESMAQPYIVINAVEAPYQVAEEQGFWDKTKDVASDTWDGAKEVTSDVWNGTKKVTSDVWDGTKDAAADIKDGVSGNNESAKPEETPQKNDVKKN